MGRIREGIIMASYKQYTNSKGTFWRVNGYLGIDERTGKQTNYNKRGFKTKNEAKHSYDTAKVQFKNEGIKKAPQRMTFEVLYEEWLQTYVYDVESSTLKKTKQEFRIHILPIFGDMFIDKIQANDVQTALTTWQAKLKKFKQVFNNFKRVLAYAVRLRYIEENPCDFVTVPKKTKEVKKNTLDFYTKDQLHQLNVGLEKMTTRRWHAYFRLLAFTGIRRSEGLALTWSDINFNTNQLTINKAVKLGEQGKYIGNTKNKQSNRVISFDNNTAAVLKKWKMEQAKNLIGFGFNAMQPNQLVFSKYKDNGLVDLSSPRNALAKICNRYDLPMINIHGFRHTHCSLLFEAGVPMKDVMERLGHSDIHTTMNIYTHVTENSKDKSAQLFSKYVNF